MIFGTHVGLHTFPFRGPTGENMGPGLIPPHEGQGLRQGRREGRRAVRERVEE